MRTLVLGAGGYVGRLVTTELVLKGHLVTTASRRAEVADTVVEGPDDLDRILASNEFDQVVHLPQLNAPGTEWSVARVDGPRWVVFSSAQMGSTARPPGYDRAHRSEAMALERGATVLRPTMIFGHNGDANISRMIRFLLRYRVPLVVGDGMQLVQPVHVDDVASLILAHADHPVAGLFGVAGDEEIAMRDLMQFLREATGRRLPVVRIPTSWLRPLQHLPVASLRRDQILRLSEDKVIDIGSTRDAFGWRPHPLRDRLLEAIQSVKERLSR